jgi:hypothetical protein
MNKILKPCGISSHTDGLRLSGKVPAALNGSFDDAVRRLVRNERLQAFVNGDWREVMHEWRILARKPVIKSWSKHRPDFNQSFKAISLEQACEAIGAESFNSLVRALLSSSDFYSLWIKE